MKNFKKVVSLLLTAALVLSMAACGGSSEKESTSESVNVIKIGGIGPTTGGAALYGIAVEQGAELAVKEINEAGGINGMQIEFKMEDDEHDAEKSLNAYNNLKDWGMQMLMGTVTSTPCTAVVEKTHEDSMFQLTPSGSSVASIQYDNAYRVCYSDPNQGAASARYIGENALATKVAVIYNSASDYSTGVYETFAAEAANQPFEIVAAEAFQGDDATDFTVQVQKAKDAGADMVFLPIYYQAASLILQEAEKVGYAPTFFGCDGMDGILGMEGFDTTLAEGLMLLYPLAVGGDDELTTKFITNYEEAYGTTPIQFAADAYDAMYIIKAAAEAANVTSDMSIEEMNEAMKAAMAELAFTGLTTGGVEMTWSADGEPNKAPMAVVIKDGVYTAM
ncbi:MAG: ABC transporter substrate-binding protein [Ruminococcus sp.]|nr:ABC transporter substrate-binding protein [Ruminococcus sp.]